MDTAIGVYIGTIIGLIVTLVLLKYKSKPQKAIKLVSMLLAIFIILLIVRLINIGISDKEATHNAGDASNTNQLWDNNTVISCFGDSTIIKGDEVKVNTPSPKPSSSPTQSPTPTVTPKPEPSPTYEIHTGSDYDLLKKAESEFEQENYETVVKIYNQMIDSNTESYIPYNNLGYIYGMGLLDVYDYHLAKESYIKAVKKGARISFGNLLCLYGHVDYSSREYYDLILKAYEQFDVRIETVLEHIYLALEKQSESLLYSENYFGLPDDEQLSITQDAIYLTQIESHHTGTSIDYSAGEVTYTYSREIVPAFDISSKQKFIYDKDKLDYIESLDSFKEKELLYIAEMSHENSEYTKAFDIYKELELRSTEKHIVFNNLGYYYANGFGCERDIEKARKYYNFALKKGNKTAIGNLLCIPSYLNFDANSYIENLYLAHSQEDSRVETMLENIYLAINKEKQKETYYDDFQRQSNQNKKETLNESVKAERISGPHHIGSSYSEEDGIKDSYSIRVYPYLSIIFDLQKYEYVNGESPAISQYY
jgi:TPR repeat protein